MTARLGCCQTCRCITVPTSAPGARIDGPAVITEDATTTIVGAAFTASIDADGAIRLRREIACVISSANIFLCCTWQSRGWPAFAGHDRGRQAA